VVSLVFNGKLQSVVVIVEHVEDVDFIGGNSQCNTIYISFKKKQ